MRIFIALIIFASSLFFPLSVQAVSPASIPTEVISPTQAASQSQTTDSVIQGIEDYYLPFPGLLPDHPLYPLKKLRDVILDRLIVDPVKKTEFYLFQADKMLYTGILLDMKGKRNLSAVTVEEAEEYMRKAFAYTGTITSSGKEIPPYIPDRFERSLGKHKQVLAEFVEKSEGTLREQYQRAQDVVQKKQAELPKLKTQ